MSELRFHRGEEFAAARLGDPIEDARIPGPEQPDGDSVWSFARGRQHGIAARISEGSGLRV